MRWWEWRFTLVCWPFDSRRLAGISARGLRSKFLVLAKTESRSGQLRLLAIGPCRNRVGGTGARSMDKPDGRTRRRSRLLPIPHPGKNRCNIFDLRAPCTGTAHARMFFLQIPPSWSPLDETLRAKLCPWEGRKSNRRSWPTQSSSRAASRRLADENRLVLMRRIDDLPWRS